MDSDNYEVIYCPEDNEYRVFCDVFDSVMSVINSV